MNTPFDLIAWALGIGIAWVILVTLTGFDDWLRKLVGKKTRSSALEAKVDALEKRVAELEKQR
jgi:hypothetical protein